MSLFKSSYHVEKLDCPSEEQMIRLKMEGLEAVLCISVNIQERMVSVVHRGDVEPISKALSELGLGSRLETSEEVETDTTENRDTQKRILWWVLGINAAFFVIEMGFGLFSNSMGPDRRLARHASRRHRLRIEFNGCRHCSSDQEEGREN